MLIGEVQWSGKLLKCVNLQRVMTLATEIDYSMARRKEGSAMQRMNNISDCICHSQLSSRNFQLITYGT